MHDALSAFVARDRDGVDLASARGAHANRQRGVIGTQVTVRTRCKESQLGSMKEV
jgi:hypothetical protein